MAGYKRTKEGGKAATSYNYVLEVFGAIQIHNYKNRTIANHVTGLKREYMKKGKPTEKEKIWADYQKDHETGDKELMKLVKKSFSSEKKEYRTVLMKTSMLIKNNGLGATVGFAFSKRDKAGWKFLYTQLEHWFYEKCPHLPKKNKQWNLMSEIVFMDSATYRALTKEYLSLMNWMRRFVDGMKVNDKT